MRLGKSIFLVEVISILIFLGISLGVQADEELDFDYDFSVHQKSTIDDFPLKEIGQEEMSNAAIAGGLQARSANKRGKGKPVFLEQKEANEKKLKSDVESDDSTLNEEDSIKYGQLQIRQPQFQMPIYQQDTGRSYNGHETHTVERP